MSEAQGNWATGGGGGGGGTGVSRTVWPLSELETGWVGG